MLCFLVWYKLEGSGKKIQKEFLLQRSISLQRVHEGIPCLKKDFVGRGRSSLNYILVLINVLAVDE